MTTFKSKIFPRLPQETQDRLLRMRNRLKTLEKMLNKPWEFEVKLKGEEKQQHLSEKFQLEKDLYKLEKEHGLTEEAQAWAYQFFPRSPKDFGLEVK